MTLTIDPRPGGFLRLTTTLDREEPRAAIAILDSQAQRSDAFVKICGWCKRILLPSDAWAEIEEAMTVLHLLAETKMPRLTHGICPDCSARLHAEIDGLAGGPKPQPAPAS
jgi:hypothetical protein